MYEREKRQPRPPSCSPLDVPRQMLSIRCPPLDAFHPRPALSLVSHCALDAFHSMLFIALFPIRCFPFDVPHCSLPPPRFPPLCLVSHWMLFIRCFPFDVSHWMSPFH